MINYCQGLVQQITRRFTGSSEVKVITAAGAVRAINYDFLTGDLREGDRVLLNTTAVDLGLGSGSYHFVVTNLDRPPLTSDKKANRSQGHIMKLRYTPLQFSVLSMEEENSPYHRLFHEFESLEGMPVLIGELHSMLLPAIFNLKSVNPCLRVAYIMTDGGALPANFSENIAFLKKKKLLDGVITFGQAFGGDYEAVNIYTALIGARLVLNADLAMVTMGPGITGTGTKYGFSGIEQGYIIDAVNTLKGRPIFIPRISFADQRNRHYGLSHHSITILEEIAKTPAEVVLPKLSREKHAYIREQISKHRLELKHKIVIVQELEKIYENILSFQVPLSTMGRGLEQDREFFLTAGAAGYYCAAHFQTQKKKET
ncbi:MAG: DUF3866 family protein [Bacillota bacterium]